MSDIKYKALDLLRSSIVINASESTYPNTPEVMFSEDFLNKLNSVGVNAVAVTSAWKPWHNFRITLERIIGTYSILGGENIIYGETVNDLLESRDKEKLAVILQFQNTIPIEYDIRLLEVWYKLGIRIMQLTYNPRNLVGDGCYEKTDGGLSNFGQKVVEEMNRIGIVIDLSHASYKSTIEAMELSKDPVIFSHSNVKSLADVPRNITNDQIKAVAENGGVVGVATNSYILKKDGEKTGTNLSDYVNHIDYIVNLVGPSHVGIGTDYTEGRGPPNYSFKSITDLVDVVAMLLDKGYSNQDLKKIIGENWLRVFKKIWKKY
ncbi:MAG: dipeptidase [Candidatus Hodarchaeota archaeon]